MTTAPATQRSSFPAETQRRHRGHAFYDGLGSVPSVDDNNPTPVMDRIVHAHYFLGGCDWWITDIASGGRIAYGWVSMGNGPEWGSFYLAELEQLSISVDFGAVGTGEVVVERNLHWTPAPARDVLAKRGLDDL